MQGRGRYWLAALLLCAGCQEAIPPAEPPAPIADERGQSFDPADSGTIRGRVSWRGELPQVPPFQVHAYLDYIIANQIRGQQPNPHAPRIDPESRGVEQVALLLRQVTPARAKPWDHAPAQVLVQRRSMEVAQGKLPRLIGFVPRGGEITCINHDVEYYTLRARGAAFFTLPFVDADRPTRRRLDQPGLVEFTCGAGHFWMRGYLFVLDHPYATLTDGAGQFTLSQVPAGTYQLAAWLPNWHVVSRERHAETGLIVRVLFAAPVEVEQTVTVTPGHTTEMAFVISPELFAKKK